MKEIFMKNEIVYTKKANIINNNFNNKRFVNVELL